jgi:broad specificity phosphatase PhoE
LQSPSSQVLARSSPKLKRMVLVRHAATASSEESRLHVASDEPCSALGEVQAMKAAEFLMDTAIENLLVSPAERAVFTAAAIAKCQSLMHNRAPRLQVIDDLKNVGVGSFSGRLAREVCLKLLEALPLVSTFPHSLATQRSIMLAHNVV